MTKNLLGLQFCCYDAAVENLLLFIDCGLRNHCLYGFVSLAQCSADFGKVSVSNYHIWMLVIST